MTRLQAEFQRLYLLPGTVSRTEQNGSVSSVRALVLELARPSDWAQLSPLWRGVQTDLDLPAPGIAVSGTEGLQLWFSLAEPLCEAQALAFLEALRQRFLPDVAPQRLRLMTGVGPTRAPGVPALQPASGNWSAFIAPDLAPLFTETPWLDTPPGEEGQAHLLSCLHCIPPAQFATAWKHLQVGALDTAAPASKEVPAPLVAAGGRDLDPRRFLLAVMHDESVALALRIEAAKALLPHVRDEHAT